VTVRANWRIIFRFEGTDAFDIELTGYHWKRGETTMLMKNLVHPGRIVRHALNPAPG
jgi:hypothetical protein